jgi:hypothetical protein
VRLGATGCDCFWAEVGQKRRKFRDLPGSAEVRGCCARGRAHSHVWSLSGLTRFDQVRLAWTGMGSFCKNAVLFHPASLLCSPSILHLPSSLVRHSLGDGGILVFAFPLCLTPGIIP